MNCKYFRRALFFFAACIILVLWMSCAPKKSLPSVDQTDITIKNRELYNEVDRNKAIVDSLMIYIGRIKTGRPECDSVCQETVNKLLSQLNTKKSSGDNSYGIFYDKYNQMLTMYANLAETVNQKSELKENNDHYFLKTTKIPVPANFSKEQEFNIWVGRLFWVFLLIAIAFWIRKKAFR